VTAAELRHFDVSGLLERSGRRKEVDGDFDLEGPATSAATPTGVAYDLVVEARGSQLIVEGSVTGRWRGECRRCLGSVDGESPVQLREVYEFDATDGETYPIEDGRIDLAMMLEEAVLLGLPLAPLCGTECAGPAPERFPTGPGDNAGDDVDEGEEVPDPRWAALDDLTFE
jgi:uncharacterized protein